MTQHLDQPAVERCDERAPEQRDDRSPEQMLGLLILAAMLVIAMVGGYFALREVRAVEARTAAVEAREALRAAEEARAADAIASLRDCRSPHRNGDRAVITVWRQGDRLIARCAYLVDPADPARALKEARP